MFQVSGILLSELQCRPKNAAKDIAVANATIRQMNSLLPDDCSMRLVNEEGKTLVCVFSHQGCEVKDLEGEKNSKVESKVYFLALSH